MAFRVKAFGMLSKTVRKQVLSKDNTAQKSIY